MKNTKQNLDMSMNESEDQIERLAKLLNDKSFVGLNSNEEKFLNILVNGNDFEGKDGERSSNDYFPKIKDKEKFIKKLIDKNINLSDIYLEHILSQLKFMDELDSGYIPFHIFEGDECLVDLNKILEDIIIISENNGQKINFSKDVSKSVIDYTERLKNVCDMRDAEQYSIEDVYNVMNELNNLIGNKINAIKK